MAIPDGFDHGSFAVNNWHFLASLLQELSDEFNFMLLRRKKINKSGFTLGISFDLQ